MESRPAPGARAAVVTPAHQSPLCISLSLPRRLALLEWASASKAWIIEDDYDGEYRYASRPLPALKGLDRDGRVLYAGTFSKVLFPSLRLAYLVVPNALVERFEQISHAFAGSSSGFTQSLVSDFMEEGHFARHIQRMRKLYAERREATAAGLEGVLGKYLSIDPQPGGMHLVLRLRGRRSDRGVVARMREDGLYGEALTDWMARGSGPSAVLLNFTNIDSQRMRRSLPCASWRGFVHSDNRALSCMDHGPVGKAILGPFGIDQGRASSDPSTERILHDSSH